MEGWELTMGVTALANGIACGLSGEELDLSAAPKIKGHLQSRCPFILERAVKIDIS